jgi:predicted alpha/beta-fold hydrolase
MTDFEHRKMLIIGFIIGASIMLLAFYWAKPSSKTPPDTSKTNFAVVDTYKGCDVVQWSDNQMATYKYFLHCNNTRPVYENK